MKKQIVRFVLGIGSAILFALASMYLVEAYFLCKPPLGIGGTNYRVQSCKDAYRYTSTS